MGIMNRDLKCYQFRPKEKGFPEKLTLSFDDGSAKTFYFGESYYIDLKETDELFISYKALPWSERKEVQYEWEKKK